MNINMADTKEYTIDKRCLTLKISDDLISLDKIYESGQVFTWLRIGYQEYLIVDGGEICLAKQNGESLLLQNPSVGFDADKWIEYFDLSNSYDDYFRKLKQSHSSDKFLMSSLEHGKGIRLLKQDPLACSLSFILSQQSSIPRIRKSMEYLIFNSNRLLDNNRLRNSIGSCNAGYRAKYLDSFVDNYDKSKLASYADLEDQDLLNAYKTYYGIGDKIAKCIALYSYRRTNLVPMDVWMKRIVESIYQGDESQLHKMDDPGIAQLFTYSYSRKVLR